MHNELSAPESESLIKRIYKISTLSIAVFLCCLAVYVLYISASFLLNLEDSWSNWSVLQIFNLFIKMFSYVLKVTFPYIFPPIIVYIFLEVCMRKFPFIIRWGAELGCTYIFYIISRMVSPADTHWVMKWMVDGLQWIVLAFQVYFLFILIMPQEFMGIIGCVASIIVSIIVYLLPDLPGSLDDIAGVCTVMATILGYINTLATIIKRRLIPLVVKFFK